LKCFSLVEGVGETEKLGVAVVVVAVDEGPGVTELEMRFGWLRADPRTWEKK